ncbi:endonuclease [Mycobacterium phage Yoshi]|uniref:GIY-YIG domain-containing protein n=1 Tax=Mycobacterium phage Yoshi TaxID=2920891 RepID=G1BSG6_9CAUD|nr:endonuclease [Mycobacterium phage Yoshi]AEK07809.1 hypothetical protein YOSHI_59 [Mycobacterium phage Yoshi]
MSAHYVYRIYDGDDRLIYVGETGDLFGRLAFHKVNSWWGSQADHAKASVYPDRAHARSAERDAIRSEQPRWNITGAWAAHRSWTADQYVDYVTAYIRTRPQLTEYGKTHIANVARLFQARFGYRLAIAGQSAA